MEKKIGAEQSLVVDFEAGKLIVIVKQIGTDGGAEIKGYVSVDRLLDKLAEKLGNGEVVKGAIALLKGALKSIG